jgi:O-antigen ligase
MGVEVADTLRLRRQAPKAAQLSVAPSRSRRLSANAVLGMGLWLLLWLGYNTGPGYLLDPRFPSSTTELIHGVRSYFPLAAAWIACLVILGRPKRLASWLMGPLGLMLLYAVTGLISSVTLSPDRVIALYYGGNYLAIVLVLLAIVQVDDPLPDLRQVLTLTWGVGTVLTLSLLGAIPMLGSAAVSQTESSPVGMRAYGTGTGSIMGMAATRNTGFARYAAISALVTLPGLMKKGKPSVRIMWGSLFAASLWALIIANGRTEIVAFLAAVAVILFAEKAKRTVNILAASAGAILLGFRGFYSSFYLYFTRTGHLDTSMSGRTLTWDDGFRLLWKSPWIGLGFQADRLFLEGSHMHNAFLHVLAQAGLVGGGAILIGLATVWYYVIKYFFVEQPSDKSFIPPEMPAVFLFVTISSFAESTFAYFSAAWLLSAPIFAYVVALHHRQRRLSVRAAEGIAFQRRIARQYARYLGPSSDPFPAVPQEEPPIPSDPDTELSP